MKKHLLIFLLLITCFYFGKAQEWMSSLRVAQSLASVEHKMILMVWEESTFYPYPIMVSDIKTKRSVVVDLFANQDVQDLVWDYFIPVIVSEDEFETMYNAIKNKRKISYLDKFSDDSIKIMDINGNILNTKLVFDTVEDISKIIQNYAIDTQFLSAELNAYKKDQNFFSAYFLASKYLDFALLSNKKLKSNIVNLAQIYIDEAKTFAEQDVDKLDLLERCNLLEVQIQLITKRPRIASRRLKRLEKDIISASNRPFYNFLYYTTHSILNNKANITTLKSEISSVNLKKAQMLINLNQ